MVPDVIEKIQGIVSPIMEKKAAKKGSADEKSPKGQQSDPSSDDIK